MQQNKSDDIRQETGLSVRPFEMEDDAALFALFEREGEEWKDYWEADNRETYRAVMAESINYVILHDGTLCGYIRCHQDGAYGVFVYDLLVDQAYRGRHYGKRLLERVREDHPGQELYVLSDSDPYYEKLGFELVGSIFLLRPDQGKLL